jgi:protein-tyrosine phosphatase
MPVPLVTIYAAGDYDTEVRRAADVIRSGGIVVLPTETVYGAAAALTSGPARQRLRAKWIASEPRPFVPHLAHRDDARVFVGDELGETAGRLIRKLWPGPVGLMFDVPEAVRLEVARLFNVEQAELYTTQGQVTLRCPDHTVASDIIGRAGSPVVVTAITQDGPARAAQENDGEVDLVIDAGPTRYSRPSTLLKVNPDGYQIVRAGVYDARIIERLLRTTILFVCSGNTCRSPMCEALARQALAQKLGVTEEELEAKGYVVTSAGSFAMPGARATPQAVEALRGMGADLSGHRSRPLSVELIHQADAIYAMGRAHATAVRSLVPSAADRTALLDPSGDIEDPIGSDVANYQSLAARLKELVSKRLLEQVQV